MHKILLKLLILIVISTPLDILAEKEVKLKGWQKINQLVGAELWQDYMLWDDKVVEVANKLKLPKESQTTYESSYRSYPSKEAKLFGTRPYSISLYGQSGSVTSLTIVFANKGDIEGLSDGIEVDQKRVGKAIQKKALKNYKRWIREDAKLIENNISKLLGKPKNDSYGQGSRETIEKVKRWNIKNHSILLACPREEYVAIRIMPTKIADAKGKGEQLNDPALMKKLSKRVERRNNGDVIIRDIPMVNQGPKGYCAPATWERYLRYLGIPADMYILAMAGKTSAGGGTQIEELMDSVKRLVQSNQRRLKCIKKPAKIHYISRYIDKGLPLMWTLKVNPDFYNSINNRSTARKQVSDWKDWKASLKEYRSHAKKIDLEDAGGHICMIIGYNNETGEIATSDSWVPIYEERWMTEEEVEAIGLEKQYVITW